MNIITVHPKKLARIGIKNSYSRCVSNLWNSSAVPGKLGPMRSAIPLGGTGIFCTRSRWGVSQCVEQGVEEARVFFREGRNLTNRFRGRRFLKAQQ